MVVILLTKGKVAIVDDCDGHLNKYRWHYRNGYAVRTIRCNGGQLTIFLHHAIMGYPLHGKQIDHISGDSMLNRRANLRIVTPRENAQNRKDFREQTKTSKYVGVHKKKVYYKDTVYEYWVARIKMNGEENYLGRYKKEEDACVAYKEAFELAIK